MTSKIDELNYWEDVYRRRLNRFGTNPQDRIQGQREKEFEDLLLKSVYRVDFEYEKELHPAILTKKSQDETESQQWLLTRRSLDLSSGTILFIDSHQPEGPIAWMVYYKEQIEASGYNRYVMLKMTHNISWQARDGKRYSTLAYFYGQEDNMLKDELQSRSRSMVRYDEPLKLSFFVMPTNPHLKKDDYFELTTLGILEAYRVTGMDIQSTPGVEFVSADPIYEYDKSQHPDVSTSTDAADYWLKMEDS